ncbi:hypothetical protein ACTHGU_03125 [Chitinophagaceae bacterium MMS25-I14]
MILSAGILLLAASCNKGNDAGTNKRSKNMNAYAADKGLGTVVLTNLSATPMKFITIGEFYTYAANNGNMKWDRRNLVNICHVDNKPPAAGVAGNGNWINDDKQTAIRFLKTDENMQLYSQYIHGGVYVALQDYQFAIFEGDNTTTPSYTYTVKAGTYQIGEDDQSFCIVFKYNP